MATNLSSKYSYSPHDAFKEVEKLLSDLRKDVDSLKNRLSKIDAMERGLLPPPIASGWKYSVLDAPLFTDNIYQVEDLDGWPKRWIGPDAKTSWDLHLRRDIEYRIVVSIVDVPSTTKIYASVDGEEVSVKHEGFSLEFIVPVNTRTFYAGKGMHLSIWVDEENLILPEPEALDNRVLAFSINSILVFPIKPNAIEGVM